MTRLVSIVVPRAEWRQETEVDGHYPITIRARLQDTFTRARAMGLTWLAPYVPQYARERVGDARWQTRATPGGFLQATAIRALRLHFGDSRSAASECASVRLLQLAAHWKLLDASVRWADMGVVDAWPIALRVDAQRLAPRFAALATATWCLECDDAPWASGTQRCLWCERIGPPPPPPLSAGLRVAA